MARFFEGLSDLEWKLLEDIFPTSDSRLRGMPHAPFGYVKSKSFYKTGFFFLCSRSCSSGKGINSVSPGT